MLGTWFDPGSDIQALESVSCRQLPGREHVSYLLRVRNADGDHLVEQQAYYDAGGARISWLRVLCSGYQPARRYALAVVADQPVAGSEQAGQRPVGSAGLGIDVLDVMARRPS